MENRRETMQEQAWWKLHCASCLLVFCAVVWCCWCWLRSEWGNKTIQTYPYSNCTFHHQSSQRKQTSFTVPTNLGKTLANIICCMCLFQHGKQDKTHASCLLVFCAGSKLLAGRMWHSISWFLYVLHYFFGRYTVLAAGSAVLYCMHMQHCTYIICSYSICICCLHILSAVWGLSSLVFFPYSICDLEVFHILSPRLLL